MQNIAHLTVKYLNFSETFIYEQIRNMTQFNPVVFTLNTNKNTEKFPVKELYSVSSLPKIQQTEENIRSIFGRSLYFRELIKKLDVKLIHAHFAYMGNYALQFKKYFNIPLVTSFYGLDIYQLTKNPLYKLQLKRLFKHGDFFLPYSSVMYERAIELGCPKEKLMTFTVGIDLQKFRFKERKPGRTINMLYIGRLVEKKGVHYLIQAFAKSYERHRNIKLTIIGDGPLYDQHAAEIKKLGLSQQITMLGYVPDLAAEIERADFFLSPSVVARSGDAEGGINVTVIEALASGMPAIVTRQTQSDLIFNGKTGFIARERDAEDLSNKMNIFIEKPELITQFGIIGRRSVEKLDSKDQVIKLERIYSELIGKYKARK
jgi:colanic acid/amylovoran biosynthesis glycosyltransferase